MDENTRKIRNGVIKDCFKDPADKDYILARYAFRVELIDQFLWLSLQAIERYCKAILLYHDENTKKLSHDLDEAIRKIKMLNTIPLTFLPESERFIEVLTTIGKDRYFTFPRRTEGWDLIALDQTVWNIRRYCQDFEYLDLYHPADIEYSSNEYIKEISSIIQNDCMHFRPLINDGHIEKVLDTDKYVEQRKVLVWKNIFFGLKRKSQIRVSKGWNFTFRKPMHFYYPKIIQWAKERILLSSEVIEHLESRKSDD